MKEKTGHIRDAITNENADFLSGKKYKNYTTCKKCHIIFIDGKWHYNETLYNEAIKKKLIQKEIVCPSCKQIESNRPNGYLYIAKEHLKGKYDDIKNMVKNIETGELKHFNPLDRLVEIKEENDQFVFTSTTPRFSDIIAKKIGKVLHKKPEFHWSEDNKFVKIYIR